MLDLKNNSHFTHFDTFVAETGTTIRLACNPEDLVFDPKIPSIPEAIASIALADVVPAAHRLNLAVPIVDPEGTPAA